MKYRLYIMNDCPACDRIQDYLNDREIPFELINVSDPSSDPVPGILIYPALFDGTSLLAYGDDIVKLVGTARA